MKRLNFNPDSIGVSSTSSSSSTSGTGHGTNAQDLTNEINEGFRRFYRTSSSSTSGTDVSSNVEDLTNAIKESMRNEDCDIDGNLKEGLPLETVLRDDGTLKPGWSVDCNGIPHFSYSDEKQDLFKNGIPLLKDSHEEPPYVIRDLPDQNLELDPHMPSNEPDFNTEPKYRVADGRLVLSGSGEELTDTINHDANLRRMFGLD